MLQLFSPSGVEQNGNVSRGRQSMDSGLDVNTTVEIELARVHLILVLYPPEHHHLIIYCLPDRHQLMVNSSQPTSTRA